MKIRRNSVRNPGRLSVSCTILLIVSVLGGCSGVTANSFCDLYVPVPTIENGTKEQQYKTDRNNAIYAEFCL